MLEEQIGGLGLYREVLLDLLPLLAPEWRVCQNDAVPVLILDVHDILIEGVGVDDVGRRYHAESCS